MDANFDYSIAAILMEEGGNDDDPHDPGGRTSRGITQREYNAYRKRKNLSTRDVWQATDAEVAEIYLISYWLPWCPQLPAGIDLFYFNMCVNAGSIQATKLLQRCLGVADDGHIGIITLGAIENIKIEDHDELVRRFATKSMAFYRSLKGWKYFGRGWTSRTKTIETKAVLLAQK